MMNERYFKVDKDKFGRLVKNWYRQKKSWKWLNVLFWAFMILGLVPLAIGIHNAMAPTVPSMDAFVLLITGGAIVSFPFYIFAYVTKSQAIRHVGKPFTSMRDIFLYSNRSGIQFGYHDRYDRKSAGSAIVHQITYENIHHVEIVEAAKLVRVIGRTERIEYINMVENRIAYRFTNGQFGDMADFSFFMAFDDEQAFFDELKAHNITITKV